MGNVNEKSDEDNHHNGKNNNNLAKDEPKEIKKEIELVIANKVDVRNKRKPSFKKKFFFFFIIFQGSSFPIAYKF